LKKGESTWWGSKKRIPERARENDMLSSMACLYLAPAKKETALRYHRRKEGKKKKTDRNEES